MLRASNNDSKPLFAYRRSLARPGTPRTAARLARRNMRTHEFADNQLALAPASASTSFCNVVTHVSTSGRLAPTPPPSDRAARTRSLRLTRSSFSKKIRWQKNKTLGNPWQENKTRPAIDGELGTSRPRCIFRAGRRLEGNLAQDAFGELAVLPSHASFAEYDPADQPSRKLRLGRRAVRGPTGF